jgi:RNA recognition motif-containing protein
MRSQDSRGGSGRRSGRGPRRSSSRSNGDRNEARAPQRPPARKTIWEKLASFFKPEKKSAAASPRPAYPAYKSGNGRSEARPSRKPEAVEVTSPKLYIGNLSYDATENDLHELFNGVGNVKSAEVVTHKDTDKSKGFGFVMMATVDEARRAVTELHDKDFMGRKLVVSGAKTGERETNYRG